MGKSYTATIEVRCWKEHTCTACGALYAYQLVRRVRGQASTPEKASANAQAAAQRAIARDVDTEACPTCGLYQPDMIGQRRAPRHLMVLLLSLPVLLLTLLFYATDVLQSYTAAWTLAVLCGLAALLHAAIALRNPNANLEANRQRATQRVSEALVRHQPPKVAPLIAMYDSGGRSMSQWLVLLLLAGAVLLALWPEAMRSTAGWPLNVECYPPVLGPGDQARVYMDQKITSIKSYWRGQPQVMAHVVGVREASDFPMVAETNQNDWGNTIYAKSSEKSNSCTPWVRLTVPEKPELAGAPLACAIDLKLELPQATDNGFRTVADHMRRDVSLQLAPPYAGGRYVRTWWLGALLASGATLAGGVAMVLAAKRLGRQAQPTRVYT